MRCLNTVKTKPLWRLRVRPRWQCQMTLMKGLRLWWKLVVKGLIPTPLWLFLRLRWIRLPQRTRRNSQIVGTYETSRRCSQMGTTRAYTFAKGVWRDTDIAGWNHRRSSLRMRFPNYVDPWGTSDMLLLRYQEERSYVWRPLALVYQFGESVRFDALDLCCWDRLFDCFYRIQDTEQCWRELDFEGHKGRGLQNVRLLGWQNFKVFAFPHDLFYSVVPKHWTVYEPPNAPGVAFSVSFSYLMMFCNDWREVEWRFFSLVVEVEFLILSLGAFLETARIGQVSRLLFVRMNKNCESYGVLKEVFQGLVNFWASFRFCYNLPSHRTLRTRKKPMGLTRTHWNRRKPAWP